MATKDEIKQLLREAMQPLEDKLENLASNVRELQSTVEFLDKKYKDVISNRLSRNLGDAV